jgi:hypothetical protein
LVLKFQNKKTSEVCPQAFAKAHNRGHTYYDRLVHELKEGAVNGEGSQMHRHCSIKPSDVKELQKNNHFGMKLTTSEFTAATLPNTILSLCTAAWMKEFFRLTGNYICIVYSGNKIIIKL